MTSLIFHADVNSAFLPVLCSHLSLSEERKIPAICCLCLVATGFPWIIISNKLSLTLRSNNNVI